MESVSIQFEHLLENARDMSDIENTHHGKLGLNRYKIFDMYDKQNYKIDYYNESGFLVKNSDGVSIHFMAPFHARIDFILNRGNLSIVSFCVPQNAFESNFMSRVIFTPKKNMKYKFLSKAINFLFKITTTKKMSKSIFDQDVNQIEGIIKNENLTNDWKYPSFTSGDSPVFLMNKWFREYYNVSNY